MAQPNVALIDLVEIREVMPWTASSSWSGASPPTSASDVSIPESACVGIAAGVSAAANTVAVEGELFVLDGAPSLQARLSTRLLHVHRHVNTNGSLSGSGGYFQVGLEAVPLQSRFSLVLDDDRVTSFGPEPKTVDALLVNQGGWVEMHGAVRKSWLHLAEHALPGSATIELEGDPGWQPGDQIVIAPTGRYPFASSGDISPAEAEVVTIQAINRFPVHPVVTLTTLLANYHCGRVLQLAPPLASQPQQLEQRAEVGLLSHNVRIVGEARNPVPLGIGGHIMIEGEEPSRANPGFARFSGVECFNLGRSGPADITTSGQRIPRQKGRYPLHWHFLLGEGRGNFMKRSSIWKSNSRVVAIHGSDYTAFEDNVGYDHRGHGVFLEDGSEQHNVFAHNLIMGTRLPLSGQHLLPSDIAPRSEEQFQNRAPAGFWITNPNNIFVDNVAAGVDGTGYWFALPRQWMGESNQFGSPARAYFEARTPSGQEQRSPDRQSIGLFQGNLCHSAFMAVDINDGVNVSTADVVTNSQWLPYSGRQTFVGFQAYSCNEGIYSGNGGFGAQIEFKQAAFADTSWNLVFASHELVTDSVIVHHSGQVGLPSVFFAPGPSPSDRNGRHAGVGVVLYDGAATLERVHFRGFDPGTNTTIVWQQGAARRRTSWSVRGLSFHDTAGLPSSPLLDPDDASQSPPSGTNFALHSPLQSHRWGFAIDNPDGSAPGSLFPGVAPPDPALPLRSLVSNHPIVRVTGKDASLGTSHAVASSFRFDFLRVFTVDAGGNPLSFFPTPGNAPLHDILWTRENPVLGASVTATFLDRWHNEFDNKRLPVIVDRAGESHGFRYLLDWRDTSGATPQPAPIPVRTHLWLAEMAPGDSLLLGLRRYPAQGAAGNVAVKRATVATNGPYISPNFQTATLTSQGSGTPQQCLSAPVTAYCTEPASGGTPETLWIRIVRPVGAGGVDLESDQMGQALLIEY